MYSSALSPLLTFLPMNVFLTTHHPTFCVAAHNSLSLAVYPDSCQLAMPAQLQRQISVTPKVIQGDLKHLAPGVRDFIESNAQLCQPEFIHICDGSEAENKKILELMAEQGMIKKLEKYENW